MTDPLLHAYLPLVLWTGLGLLIVPLLPEQVPRLLGRGLYWVGVPLQIFTLARQTEFVVEEGFVPALVAIALLVSLMCSWVSLQCMRWQRVPIEAGVASPVSPQRGQDPATHGSFVLASMLGNTGFVGLAVAPSFVGEEALGWLVLFSVTNNVIGTYGLGVVIASFYGRSHSHQQWWIPMRDLLTVPSLWAFGIGLSSRPVRLPVIVESGLHYSLWFIIPTALLLMGIRLRQIKGWHSLQRAIVPTLIKVIVQPTAIAGVTILLGLATMPRLAMVLMAGMPTAFAGLILAEEYELDRDLIASSIVLTTITLLLTVPVWFWMFGHRPEMISLFF